MKKLASVLFVSAIAAGAANASELRDYALEHFQPIPSTVPNLADNPTSPEKVDLGKKCSLIRVCLHRGLSAVIPATT